MIAPKSKRIKQIPSPEILYSHDRRSPMFQVNRITFGTGPMNARGAEIAGYNVLQDPTTWLGCRNELYRVDWKGCAHCPPTAVPITGAMRTNARSVLKKCITCNRLAQRISWATMRHDDSTWEL
jgi:hypothetical protein